MPPCAGGQMHPFLFPQSELREGYRGCLHGPAATRSLLVPWLPAGIPTYCGHSCLRRTCPLLGVKRTCSFVLHMSAFDPKRTCIMLYGVSFPRAAHVLERNGRAKSLAISSTLATTLVSPVKRAQERTCRLRSRSSGA